MIDTNTSEHVHFWKCLRRWHDVIAYVMRKGYAPRGMTDYTYVQLHRDLLGHLRVSAADQQPTFDQVRQSLHRSVRPWVNLDSIERSDKRVLRMLEQEIGQICNQLMPRQQRRAELLRRVTAVLIVLALVTTTIVMFGSSDERAVMATDSLAQGWQSLVGLRAQLWLGFTQSSTNQRLVALAGSMVLLGLFFLRDPKRS